MLVAIGYFGRPWVEPYLAPQASEDSMANLGPIYDPTVHLKNLLRNPVIIVPGMMGSTLEQSSQNRIVWGVFDSNSIDPNVASDVRLLGCPIDGTNLDNFDDGVQATGVLGTLEVSLAGLPIDLNAYSNILRTLGAGGYRDEQLGADNAVDYTDRNFSSFSFAFDWRRDNAESARRLHNFLLEKKAYVEADRKRRFGIDEPVKFDIVAHSMGGLVARYFLRYGGQGVAAGDTPELNWAGCEHVDRVVLIAPPNNGSAKSFVSTQNGFRIGLKDFPSGLVATLPSIYQLLPNSPAPMAYDEETGQALDLFDVEMWDQRGWGLLNPDQAHVLEQLLPDVSSARERRQIAKAHVQECLRRAVSFKRALNIPAAPPEGTTLHLFAGDAIATVESLTSNLKNRTLSPRSRAPGDGTITRQSALGDQRTPDNWSPMMQSPVSYDDVRFWAADHFGLTRGAEFADNALYLLIEDPTKSSPSRLVTPQKKHGGTDSNRSIKTENDNAD